MPPHHSSFPSPEPQQRAQGPSCLCRLPHAGIARALLEQASRPPARSRSLNTPPSVNPTKARLCFRIRDFGKTSPISHVLRRGNHGVSGSQQPPYSRRGASATPGSSEGTQEVSWHEVGWHEVGWHEVTQRVKPLLQRSSRVRGRAPCPACGISELAPGGNPCWVSLPRALRAGRT